MIKLTLANLRASLWPFVAFLLAFAIYLGQFDFLLKPKALPIGPPASSSRYPPIYVRHFDTRSEAEQVCGKNKVTVFEAIPPTELKDWYICSDWDDRGPL